MITQLKRWAQWLGVRLVAWGAPPCVVPVVVSTFPDPAIEAAVRFSFRACGLDPNKITPDFDIQATGKMQDVLHHAALKLDRDHKFRTVGDLLEFLNRLSPGNGSVNGN